MSRSRSPEQRRVWRQLAKRQRGGGLFCDLCGESAETKGEAMQWLDAPAFPERGTILFILCHLCMRTNYTEKLNLKHRQTWSARHGAAQGTPEERRHG
jgi:hypothetical protein